MGENFSRWAGTILVYSGGKGDFWSNYPLFAWLETVVLGLVFGKLLQSHGNQVFRWGFWTGLASLAGFVVIRLLNGFGTIRPLPINDWMGFLGVVKYPPSLAFILLTIGLNLILLGGFFLLGERLDNSWNPLLVFGRVPLFFYLIHIYLYQMMGRMMAPGGSDLGVMYFLWIIGLVILYLPCRWYGRFKAGQPPGSWVRFF